MRVMKTACRSRESPSRTSLRAPIISAAWLLSCATFVAHEAPRPSWAPASRKRRLEVPSVQDPNTQGPRGDRAEGRSSLAFFISGESDIGLRSYDDLTIIPHNSKK